MRILLAAAAATLALAASTAVYAQTVSSGDVTLAYTYNSVDVDNASDVDANSFSVAGRVAIPVSGSLGAQIDGGYTYTDADDSDSIDTIGATGHLFVRNEQYMIGGFFGASDADDVTAYGGGLEGEYYLPTWSLGGRLSYATADDDDVGGADIDVYGLDAYGKFFASDNWSAKFGAGLGSADFNNAGGDEDFWNVNASTEYLLTGLPISLTAGVSYVDFDNASNTALTVGARWNFGGQNLKARNRTGADLDGFATPLRF